MKKLFIGWCASMILWGIIISPHVYPTANIAHASTHEIVTKALDPRTQGLVKGFFESIGRGFQKGSTLLDHKTGIDVGAGLRAIGSAFLWILDALSKLIRWALSLL